MIPCLFAIATLLAFPPVTASPVTVTGRIVRIVAGDTVAAPRTTVILHRVNSATQGPIDSMPAASDGSFHFRISPDSGDIFLVSARWDGVEYFGQPLTAEALSANRTSQVVVADTSASAVVRITIRQIVIVAPTADGSREVVDVVSLVNRSGQTRVASGTPKTSWHLLLPHGATGAHLDDSDFDPDAFQQRGDTMMLLAPIPPGEHILYLSYHIPPGTRRFALPSAERIDSVSLMAGEGKLKVSGGFTMVETKELEGKTFSHWEGKVAAGDSIVVALPGDGTVPSWLLPALVALMGGGLVVAGSLAMRRSAAPSRPPVMPVSPAAAPGAAVLDAIVRLDATHAGGAAEMGEERWNAYLEERQRLKDRLRDELGGPPAADAITASGDRTGAR